MSSGTLSTPLTLLQDQAPPPVPALGGGPRGWGEQGKEGWSPVWGGLWVAQGALGWTRFPVGCLCPPPAFRSLQTPSPLYFQNKKGSEKGGLGGGGEFGAKPK